MSPSERSRIWQESKALTPEKAALARIAAAVPERGTELGLEEDRIEKMRACLRGLMKDPHIVHDVVAGLSHDHETAVEDWGPLDAKILYL